MRKTNAGVVFKAMKRAEVKAGRAEAAAAAAPLPPGLLPRDPREAGAAAVAQIAMTESSMAAPVAASKRVTRRRSKDLFIIEILLFFVRFLPYMVSVRIWQHGKYSYRVWQ